MQNYRRITMQVIYNIFSYAMQPAYLVVAGCDVCMMLPGTNAFLSHQTVFHSPIVPVSEEKLAPILYRARVSEAYSRA